MGATVRARVKGGTLELLETVNLPEGEEVTVTIIEAPSRTDREAFRRAAGAWRDTVDAETLIRNIYADRLISTRPEPRL
jgi:predicted DNA-binding antitoxin AbrB/MazE fold protein